MLELLRARRSIRKYQGKPVANDKVEILKEALLRSPSSRGINPWEFIFIDNRQLLAKLSQAKENGSEFLKEAALGIIICADETKSDVWIEDCSIAAILTQLVAQSLGLGSCWIQIRNRQNVSGITSEEYIRQLMDIPEYFRIECIIALGYPAEKKRGIPANQLDHAKIRLNSWIHPTDQN
jgi:nitroreductase